MQLARLWKRVGGFKIFFGNYKKADNEVSAFFLSLDFYIETVSGQDPPL